MNATAVATDAADLVLLAKALRLPALARHCESMADTAEHDGWSVRRYLHALLST